MSARSTVRIVTGFLLLGLAASAAWAGHDKTVIIVENKSKSQGEISFTFTPVGGEPQEIEIGVIKGMAASEIAQDVMKQFTLALDGGTYKVKMKDAQKVAIEGNPKIKDREIKFAIALSGNSVNGVSVVIK